MENVTLNPKEQARLQVLNSLLDEHMTLDQAATLMGVTTRHTRRILAAYREEGAAAVAHGHRGRKPANATPDAVVASVVRLARTRYEGANHTHLSELLSERDSIDIGRTTLRRILLDAGLTSPRRRRPPKHRVRRQRMPREGMLIQMDGSHHPWLGDQAPPFALLKGARRPALKTILDQPQATGASVAVAWYNGTTRTVELTSQTAVWYRSGKPPVLIRWVLIRDPQVAFATQALLCTDPAADPTQILEWFVLRWQLEVTPYQVRGRLFQEVRTHLGVETQRQWSDLAIARTTPVLLGIFSWTTLAAHGLQKQRPMTQRRAAWYDKPSPTFVDAIALVRRHLWLASEGFSTSAASPRYAGTPSRSVPPTCRFPGLRRLKCGKSSQDVKSRVRSHLYQKRGG